MLMKFKAWLASIRHRRYLPEKKGPVHDFGTTSSHPTVSGLLLAWGDEIAGSLGPELSDREERRSVNLFHILTLMGRPLKGVGEVHDQFVWLGNLPGLEPNASALFKQCAMHLVKGVDRILSTDGETPIDEARWLMEAQYLVNDFAADPTKLAEWATLPSHRRSQEYGFGKTRWRHEIRMGLDAEHVLPVRNEYRTHSTSSHPVPAHELSAGDLSELRDVLWTELVDLLQHGYNAWQAALGLVLAIADSTNDDEIEEQIADPPSVSTAEEVLAKVRDHERAAGIPETPTSLHVKDDGRRVLRDGAWVQPDRNDGHGEAD